jgi:hypothetical protein
VNTHKVLLAILKKQVAPCLLCITGLFGASFAVYANSVSLGSASPFTVLSASGAVNCTNSTIEGAVSSAVAGTKTSCVQSNGVVSPISQDTQTDFHNAYSTLAVEQCDYTLATLAGQVLEPGTYCVDNASTNTASVLTLNGDEDDTWLFKIGTSGAGALTGTDFVVDMIGGAQACNVTWWVADAVTLTRGDFKGDILAGQAVTVTGVASNSPLKGRIMAEGTVVLTNADALGCVAEAAARTDAAIAAALAAQQAAEEAAAVALLALVNTALSEVIGSNGENIIGAQGATGATGQTGLTGAQGQLGNTGATGGVGATGAAGAIGSIGNTGAKGDTGAAGAIGGIGNTGAKGEPGAAGAIGSVGNTGAKGDTGAAGAIGGVGNTGAKGDTGAAGAAGAIGGIGNTGAKGEPGAAGAIGSIGNTGAKGDTGAAGLEPVIWFAPPIADNYEYPLGQVWIDTSAKAVYILANNTARAAVWINTAGSTPVVTYAIGDDGPAGGVVFYITDGGLHGLEAARVDQSTGAPWCTAATDIPGTGTIIGTGATNTVSMLALCSEAGSAPTLADAYTRNGYNDWFLPSRDELNELYRQKDVVGGFASYFYWSSSQYFNGAWIMPFLGTRAGEEFGGNKSYLIGVRAVRAF